MSEVTVGVDIGTTSVKAVAVDGDGTVLARARRPHDVVVAAADRFEHRPDQAWRDGVRGALADVVAPLAVAGRTVAAVEVAAMIPSLCAVDAAGEALTPGLLYGDARGRASRADGHPGDSDELLGFVEWCAHQAPDAHGYWPAQAVANHALGGEAVLDTTTAMSAGPLFARREWDADVAEQVGVAVEQLPRVVRGHVPAGKVGSGLPGVGALLGGGTIDAFAEQLVAGADRDGDVLVICGTSLIVWAVVPEWREVDGLWTVPHSVPGKVLVGGASNAGGLFIDQVRRLVGGHRAALPPPEPDGVPVWAPYIRGERTPLHDPARRAGLHDLDLTHDAAAVRRAAYEASGFVVRHHLDRAGVDARRIVATGGGVRVGEWVGALADCTGLPVDVVAVPEGAALGAAFLARLVAGLESSAIDACRWARTARTVEPDPDWVGPAAERYRRFRTLTDSPRP